MALALLGGDPVRSTALPPHPVLGQEERDQVLEVLATGELSGFIANASDAFHGGPKVRLLESEIKEYFGVKNAIAVNSATAGLHAAVAALNLGPGDEVIVSPYTMSASASAILMTNAVPVFADVDPFLFTLDPESVRRSITPQTKAIVVVHLFGQAAEMDEILAIAREHGLGVVEDCAQAPGATYRGRKVGTLGDLGVFSLNQHKTITTGEGGWVLTDDDHLAQKVRFVRNHGEVIVGPMGFDDIIDALGWNYRMTELEAAVGIAQFRKLETLTEHRIRLARRLFDGLEVLGIQALGLPRCREGDRHVWFLFPLLFNAEKAGFSRDALCAAINAEGIPFGGGYMKPIYLEPMYQRQLCYGDRGCPFTCPFFEGTTSYGAGRCPTCERLHFDELLVTAITRYPLTEADMDEAVLAVEKIFAHATDLAAWDAARS